ncbi:hypothetical protein CERSUDRAFT_97515 [Gelatoporia subvermispora B]|uniref:non-specific serine/threonine protein kinase n=1 Tax=Ceriporiopsis subvermispora (strain B) TaxID=914234 RepID=M2R780_CERS8|nr:hypothetical protein CERSUDRAFT_97515 [Gelatoporia subvermispora B]
MLTFCLYGGAEKMRTTCPRSRPGRHGRRTRLPLTSKFSRLLQLCIAASVRFVAALDAQYWFPPTQPAPQLNGIKLAIGLGIRRFLPRLFEPCHIPLVFADAFIRVQVALDASTDICTDVALKPDSSQTNQLDTALTTSGNEERHIVEDPVVNNAMCHEYSESDSQATELSAGDDEASHRGIDAPDASPAIPSSSSSLDSASTPDLTDRSDSDPQSSGTRFGSEGIQSDTSDTVAKDYFDVVDAGVDDKSPLEHVTRDKPSLEAEEDIPVLYLSPSSFDEVYDPSQSPRYNASDPELAHYEPASTGVVGTSAGPIDLTDHADDIEQPAQPRTFRPLGDSVYVDRDMLHVQSPAGEKYAMYSLIAQGGWSAVYWAQAKDGSAYAIKVSRKDRVYRDMNGLGRMLREQKILTEITEHQKRGLVGIVESWSDLRFIYFVMPLCPVSLVTLLESPGDISPTQLRRFCAELVIGLRSLHELGYIHRDLKPANIVMDPLGHLRIADMGLADGTGNGDTLPAHKFKHGPVGTVGCVAPEVCPYPPTFGYNWKADIFGLGFVLLHILARKGPGLHMFAGISEFPEQLGRMWNWTNDIESYVNAYVEDDEAKALLIGASGSSMLDFNCHNRPSLEQIMAHAYFAGDEAIDWDSVGKDDSEMKMPYLKDTFRPPILDTAEINSSREDEGLQSNVLRQSMEEIKFGDFFEYRASDDILDDIPYNHGCCALVTPRMTKCSCHRNLCWC